MNINNPPSTLLEHYNWLVETKQCQPDPYQKEIVLKLNQLSEQLEQYSRKSILKKLTTPPKGFYLYGDVGRGKTKLMDLFFDNLKIKQKKREHFHAFMKTIHDALKTLQGKKNPLNILAKEFSQQYKILCLDEFLVNDIADAMILAQLFDALYQYKFVIILTSNLHPDQLYLHGLQREKFLPAIAQIKKNMAIEQLQSQQDYRLGFLNNAKVFYKNADHDTMKQLFQSLTLSYQTPDIVYHQPIYVYDKPIQTIAHTNKILWCDFQSLCSTPRSQLDYLMIAKQYSLIVLDNIHPILESDRNTAKYFITLIDILYDAKIILLINATADYSALYPNGPLKTEFQRTLSRLTEMQSIRYLEQSQGNGFDASSN